MKEKDSIFFWFDSPPKVGKGAFNYVANNWPKQVYFVFNNDFRAERKAANWNDGDFGKAHIIALYNEKSPETKIHEIFSQYSHSVHIVNGFSSLIMKKISHYVCQEGMKLLLLSERPDQMGNWYERILRDLFFQIKYRWLYRQFKPYVKAFLPLGGMGKDTFRRYGWEEQVMFPFMYNPPIEDISSQSMKDVHHPIKFLYVGRFYYKTKGTDVLMKAISYLEGDWTLDLVGGYGKNADDVIKWAETEKNVHYIGKWNSLEVTKNMQQYDVVVIPTKYDGWNLLVNEGLHAGIGVITTNEAVSHEIIEKSGAGIVVQARSPRLFAEALQHAIDNPTDVIEWKRKAEQFVPRISTPVVGAYLIDIINYSIYNEGERPLCPWA